MGKFLVDLGKVVRVRKINTYSWHEGIGPIHPPDVPHPPDSPYTAMAPQRYTLYGACGNSPPPFEGDPVEHGWTRICHVDTDAFFSVPPILNRPPQQAVSISGADGEVGRYRYLLWAPQATRVLPDLPQQGKWGTLPPSSASSTSTRRKRGRMKRRMKDEEGSRRVACLHAGHHVLMVGG